MLHIGMSDTTVYGLFAMRARAQPAALAIVEGDRRFTYGALLREVDRFSASLLGMGVVRGDRIAILSENRWEYLAVQLACARIGAIAACQNWRLARPELQHCIALVDPVLVLASARYLADAQAAATGRTLLAIETLGAITSAKMGKRQDRRTMGCLSFIPAVQRDCPRPH